MVLCTLRLLRGPTARTGAGPRHPVDVRMLLALVLGIDHGSQIYFEAALLIALLGFVSTVALARVPDARRGDRMSALHPCPGGGVAGGPAAGGRRAGHP